MKLLTVKIFLAVAVLFTCSASFMSYINYQHYTNCTSRIKQTNELVLKTTELLSIVKDAETGQRGYLLTNDPTYLDPFQSYIEKIDEEKQELSSLTDENPHLKEDLALIVHLISRKEALMKRSIRLLDSSGFPTAVKLIKSNKGKIIMDSIRTAVATMLQKENAILKETSAEYDKELWRMNVLGYGFQSFVIIVSIFAFLKLSRQESLNRELIIGLQESKRDLEKKVKERTKDLHAINQELSTQNEEIQSQTEQISAQYDQLIRINKEKNHFIGVVTHDLKSPLNRIKGLVSILQASPDATVSSQNEYLEMVLATIASTQSLISDLLDINKIEEGKRKLTLEEFDLVPYFGTLISIFDGAAKQKQIRLEYVHNLPTLLFKSDKGMLLQVIENLISNALKFSQQGTQVILRIQKKDTLLQISVEDQGPGIGPEEISLLFGKFQKLSNKPTGGESSTGLGLSIVKDLVETMGGRIYCESALGKGSSFIVEFPLA